MRRALVITAALLCGCQSDFDPATYLDSVRVIAVKAEPPEIATGETTTLSALSFGLKAPLEWSLCTAGPMPGSNDPVNTDCVTKDSGDIFQPIGTGDQVAFTMPPVTSAQLGLPDSTLGVYVNIRVTARGLDPEGKDRVVRGIYRLRYHSDKDPRCKNENPRLSFVYTVPEGYSFPVHEDAGTPMGGGIGMCSGPIDGGTFTLPDAGASGSFISYGPGMPIPVGNGKTVHLAASFEVGSDESYTLVSGDPASPTITQRRESLTLFWYAGAGSFSLPTTGLDQPATDFTADKHVPTGGGAVDLYVVARDERGGTDFAKRTIQIQ